MKYRELTQNEIEAYNIGYKNGSRQAVIKVLEYETPEEKKFYRQGYNAGCQDRKRHNVNTREIESNVSNVSNVKSHDSAIAITNTIVDVDKDIGGVGGKGKNIPFAFIPPKDSNEVFEYAAVSGIICSQEQAEDFFDYYSGLSWCLPNEYRTPMQDWKPFFRKWLRRPIKTRVSQKPDENEFRGI